MGVGYTDMDWEGKVNEGIFWGDYNVGYTGVYTCQNSSNDTLTIGAHHSTNNLRKMTIKRHWTLVNSMPDELRVKCTDSAICFEMP